MKKLVSLFLCLAALSATMMAKPVSSADARRVAGHFLATMEVSQPDLRDISSSMSYHEFYTFVYSEGFVLVAGDDRVSPILAFSTDSRFVVSAMPAHIKGWLQGYEEQLVWIRQYADEVADAGWQQLLAEGSPVRTCKSAVAPLLSTTWNQSPYYNSYCPTANNSSGHAVAGCTAIAMAQIMKFWNHPATGYGSHSYTSANFGIQSANFGNTSYAWSSMPVALSSGSSSAQVSAVATLVYHVGVAVEMNYGANSSGAATFSGGNINHASAENALRTYFKYSPALHAVHLDDYSLEGWRAMLMNELDNGRPVLYTGYDTSAGHAFVCDGCTVGADGTANAFHINWGWGGWCDGYYQIGLFNPTPGGTGGNSSYTFNLDNSVLIGIEPAAHFGSGSVVSATTNGAVGSVTGGGPKAFADTVELRVSAPSGYYFEQWSDGYRYNPRRLIATGDTLAFTAIVKPLDADTMGYCSDHQLTSFGNGSSAGDTYWGIRLPASAIASGCQLSAIRTLIAYTGVYDLAIYTDNVSTANLIYSQNGLQLNATGWQTIALSTPVAVDGNHDILIRFHTSTLSYPAALSYNSGNADALLWGSDLASIASAWDYSFMIRALFEPLLSISGPRNVTAGQAAQFVAHCSAGPVSWTLPSANPSSASGDTVSVVFPTAGSYIISASANQGTIADTFLVTVSPAPASLSFRCSGEGEGAVYPVGGSANFCGQTFSSIEGTETSWDLLAGPHSLLSHLLLDGEELLTDGATDSLRLVRTLSGDDTLQLLFTLVSYQVTVEANNAEWGTVSGSGTYVAYSHDTLRATAADGYEFVQWDDGDIQNPRIVEVLGDATYVAQFQAKPVEGIDVADQQPMKLSPNPVQRRVLLEAWPATVEVYDVNGRCIYRYAMEGAQSQLDVSDWSKGVYIVRLISGSRCATQRLIVR